MSELLNNAIAKVNRPEMELVQDQVTPMGILQLAISQGADIDKLTKLMELQERWEANKARKAFNAAMAKFKANPPQISKNKHVKFGTTEYDHATLDHVSERITSALSAVGISHKWAVQQKDGQISVSCVLTHELGHSESTTLMAGADGSGSKNAIQAIGSAVTYLQRYTLLAATGMAAGIDDDGKASATLSDEEFARHKDYIEAAEDLPSLQKAFTAAFQAAAAANDTAAMANYTRAKDARKKAINANR